MAIFYPRRIDPPILFNEKGSRVAACMVIYMTLKLAITAAMALWKTGLPEKAIKYIFDKANVILLDERSDRESFQDALEHYTDDELMIYVVRRRLTGCCTGLIALYAQSTISK